MEALQKQYSEKLKQYENQFHYILIFFTILSVIFIYSIVQNIQGNSNLYYIYIIACYIGLSFYSSNIHNHKAKIENNLKVINLFEQRKKHQFDLLDEGIEIEHPQELEDLHIVGKHSFFQYMNIAKTKQGKEKLIQRFLNTEPDQQIYQEAIQIFAKQKDNMISLQSNEIIEDLDALKQIFNRNHQSYQKFLLIDIFLDLFTFVSIFLFSIEVVSMIILFHFCISSFYLKLIPEYSLFQKAIITIKEMQLKIDSEESSLLNQINEKLRFNSEAKKKINRIDTMIHFDQNIISSLIGNSFFSLRLLMLLFIDQMNLDRDINLMIDAYSELEAIACFSYLTLLEKMNKVRIGNYFETKQMRNPLVNSCIPNDFYASQKVNIITGSNMSGKTSFLRAVGINCLFANASGLCFCDHFITPIYHIYTSMNVKDDPSKGISTFYGELLRVNIALKGNGPKLILIDEIFKGTNYNDRITGARSIIDKLKQQDTLTLITTHDFQLCDEKEIDNYYFIEEYFDDQIHFDYTIHQGKNTASNALYLMRKLGMISLNE